MSETTDSLNPDLTVDEGETTNYDTSVGGTDVEQIVAEEPAPLEPALEAAKVKKAKKQKLEESVKCEEIPHELVGRTVIYYTKVADQRILGHDIAPRTGLAVRIIAQHEDGTVDVETVSRFGDTTVKFYGVAEGGDLGQFRK